MSRAKTAANEAKDATNASVKPVEQDKKTGKNTPPVKPTPPAPPPLFRKIDWLCFVITTLAVLIGYYMTLAPDVTLEDSGELAVGSFYAGVPHPPGYPFWTLYTWLFTVLVPVSNIAWRVALSSAVAGAFSCGLIGLLVSRGSSMMVEGIPSLKSLEKKTESILCVVAGFCSGMLMGFNGFMWSQAVIVEVYTLSVLSLMAVLCLLLRWIYAPHQRKYLYWALFWFGVCFTNHQTLIVAAMGIQVGIVAAHRKLGRDMLFANSLIYLIVLIAKAKGMVPTFDSTNGEMNVMFIIFNMVGIASLGGFAWLYFDTEELLTEWKSVVISGICWCLGAAFYFYMPLASMTNPPMNWGYPRTMEGFKHALTRGQYEKANPANFIKEPGRFAKQVWRYAVGVIEEFNVVYVAIGLIPLFFLLQMPNREKAWILGLGAVYLCLAIILLILLNPQPDKQSMNLNKVFFTSSHVMVAMSIGYGLVLGSAWLILNYEEHRRWALIAGGVATFLAIWVMLVIYEPNVNVAEAPPFYRFGVEPSFDPLVRFTSVFTVGIAVAFLFLLVISPKKFPLVGMAALFAIMPVKPILSHWDDNEQHGHMFGYWFGHDMFTPPFKVYPEMAKNAILFGGTDPGRFNPTYMIFCESFIPASKKPNDPDFDRRDVYLITQNALADGTYLSYIRAHYFRSAQTDPPFFQDLFPGPLKTIAAPLDSMFTSLGAKIEARRRAEGVYPKNEIYTPSLDDSKRAFDEYMADAVGRMQRGQLQPGEDVRQEGNRVSVSGQVSVMAINGILTKIIFDKNPTNEFYVEESYPLQWMYPYQTPFGIIMKINREPVKEFTEEITKKDHAFWAEYSKRLTGDWVTEKTSVKEISEWAERVYIRRNFDGFQGDRKFVRDDNGQKAFSKLRSAIAGLYVWRINHCSEQLRAIQAKPVEEQRKMQDEIRRLQIEQERVVKEADFAYKQAFAFCPYSPEVVFRYTSLLSSLQRFEDAFSLVDTALRFDPDNGSFQQLRDQLAPIANQMGGKPQQPANTQVPLPAAGPKPMTANPSISQLEKHVADNPDDLQATFNLISAYASIGQTNRVFQLLDGAVARKPKDFTTVASVAQAYLQLNRTNDALKLLNNIAKEPNLDAAALTTLAHLYSQLGQVMKLEESLTRLTAVLPDSAEAWYDLAAIRAVIGSKQAEAINALAKAIQLSNARLAKDPKANNLVAAAQKDDRFAVIRNTPAFAKALQGAP